MSPFVQTGWLSAVNVSGTTLIYAGDRHFCQGLGDSGSWSLTLEERRSQYLTCPGERNDFSEAVRKGVKKKGRMACRQGGSHIPRNLLVRAATWEHRNCSVPSFPLLVAGEEQCSSIFAKLVFQKGLERCWHFPSVVIAGHAVPWGAGSDSKYRTWVNPLPSAESCSSSAELHWPGTLPCQRTGSFPPPCLSGWERLSFVSHWAVGNICKVTWSYCWAPEICPCTSC